MTASTRKIETEAVSYITTLVNRCPHLHPFFGSNDKTPFTDGHIDIQNAPESEKVEEFQARVYVQVKGTTNSTKTFQLERKYLDAHLKNGGVLLFVIHIQNGIGSKASYRILSPFTIVELLKDVPSTQKSISIPLKELPTDLSKIEGIVQIAGDKRREDPKLNAVVPLDSIERIHLSLPENTDLSKPRSFNMLEDDYLVTVDTNQFTDLPRNATLLIIPPDYIEERIEHPITCGSVTFDYLIRKRIDEDTVELKLSEGLKLFIKNPKTFNTVTLQLKLQNRLSDRINDLLFYTAFLNRGKMEINSNVLRYDMPKSFEENNIFEHLRYLQNLAAVLKELGVSDLNLINIDSITDEQNDELYKLYLSVIKGEYTTSRYEQPMRYHQRIGEDWILDTMLVPEKAKNGRARCVSFFAPTQQFIAVPGVDSGYDQPIRKTPFDLVDSQNFCKVLNLPLSNIVEYYENIREEQHVSTLANDMVLTLVASADQSTVRRNEFLSAAHELNNWLVSSFGKTAERLINEWQIKKRQDFLSDADLNDIRELKFQALNGSTDDKESRYMCAFACTVLLEEKSEADFLLKKISSDAQNILQNYPIWRLYEDLI